MSLESIWRAFRLVEYRKTSKSIYILLGTFFWNTMLLLTESPVHTRKYLLWHHAVQTKRSEVRAEWRHNKYYRYGPNSRLIRVLLYTHTSKITKGQCFPLLLWTEVQPVHTPVRTQAYGPVLSQSNFSILSVICLVYNKGLKVFYEPLGESDTERRVNVFIYY